MRRGLLLALALAGCSDGGQTSSDGGSGLVSIELTASPQPIYPCANTTCDPQIASESV